MLIPHSRDLTLGTLAILNVTQHLLNTAYHDRQWLALLCFTHSMTWSQISKPFRLFILKNIYPFCPWLLSCKHHFLLVSNSPSLSFVLIPSNPLFVGSWTTSPGLASLAPFLPHRPHCSAPTGCGGLSPGAQIQRGMGKSVNGCKGH